MCTCNAGTGRVNEADVTLPCLGECQEHSAFYKHWLLVKGIKPHLHNDSQLSSYDSYVVCFF